MVLNTSPNETYLFRTDTLRFTDVNRNALDNLGYTLEAMQALTPLDIKPETTEASFRELIDPLLTGEQAQLNFRTMHQRKNGSTYPVEVHLQVVGQGEDRTFFAFVHDVTVRMQQEQRQTTQYAITRLLLESNTLEEAAPYILGMICQTLDWNVGIMWRLDKKMQVLRCAEIWDKKADCTQFIERTRQSDFAIGIGLPGRVWKSRRIVWIPDVTRDDNFPRALSAANAGLHAAFAFPIGSRDQLYGVMEFFATELREPDQKLLDMFEGLAGQISQFLSRKQTEQALRISESRVSGILDIAEEAIVSVDEAHRITQFNQGASKAFGYATSEVLGQSVDMLLPSRFAQAHDRHIREFGTSSDRSRGMGSRREIAGRRKNGEEFPAEASITKICVNGETTFTVILRDITERKLVEQRLQNAKSRAEQAVREKSQILTTVEAFFIGVTNQGMISEWTNRAESILGVSTGNAIDRSLRDLPIAWNWDEIVAALKKTSETLMTVRLEKVRLLVPGAKEKFIRMTFSPICEDRGVTYVIMGEDVTDRLVLEHELVQAQKLESIGQLAAGIAHEINTPTQFVGDNVRFLSDSFSDIGRLLKGYQRLLAAAKTGLCPETLIETCEAANRGADLEYLLAEIPKAIKQSAEGIDRVATIVRAMKEFAYPGNTEKVAINLNKAIESTVTVARNEWKYVADLHTDLDPSLPPVPCLVGEFNQVVLNMIVNATHAIADVVKGTGGKGTITICTSRVGDFVEVRIADTGMGIPESIRHKIFDPFFTTKKVGQGTGQGLAIARSVVVSKHAGTITVASEVGKGTTFLIRLPLNASPANSAKEGES